MANNKKRTKLTPNAFDVFIILLAVLLLAATAYRLFGNFELGRIGQNKEYVVEFECKNEYNSLTKYIESGDNVYIMSSGELLGTIYTDDSKGESLPIWEDRENVTLPDSSVPENGENGTTEEGTDEIVNVDRVENYHKTVLRGKLLLDKDARSNNNGIYFSVHDFNLTVGSEFQVYTDKAIFTITVLSITEIEK